MAKKSKVKKTLVDQILDKAKIDHDSLSFNGLEGELPEDVARVCVVKLCIFLHVIRDVHDGDILTFVIVVDAA